MRSSWIGLGALALAAGCAADGVADNTGFSGQMNPITPSDMDNNDNSGNGNVNMPPPAPPPAPVPDMNGDMTGGGNGDKCDELFVRATPAIPDMLIVMDKSASMTEPDDRWGPSVSAIETITAGLEDRVRFGLMLFPDDPQGFFQTGCQRGFMAVPPALNTNSAISSTLQNESADGGSTPIPGTLDEALKFLDQPVGPDQVEAPAFVLLLTDGVPNCLADGTEPGLFPSQQFYDDALQDSYAAVDALTAADIPTYVIGYDTQNTPELAMALDEMARRGGTGDTAHRPVEDEASLLAEIESIAGQIVSCTYELTEPPGDPTYVRVTLDGTDIPMGDNGWQVRGDTTIELTGSACESLRDNMDHTIEIVVECAPVMIQ